MTMMTVLIGGAMLLFAQGGDAPAGIAAARAEDAARTADLNRAIHARAANVDARNLSAQRAYDRERADYEAARSENDRARLAAAEAAASFARAQAAHERDMAEWRTRVAALDRPISTAPATGRPATAPARCHQETMTGSRMRTIRLCSGR